MEREKRRPLAIHTIAPRRAQAIKAFFASKKGVGSTLFYMSRCRVYSSRLYREQFAISFSDHGSSGAKSARSSKLLLLQAADPDDAYDEQRTAQPNSGVWDVEMTKTGNAASTRELLRVHALQTALIDIGKDGGCPDRVRADQLIKTTEEHLRHIYSDVLGGAEGCTRLEGRGPK